MNEYKDVFRRIEIKYLITREQYERLIPRLAELAEVDEYGLTRINNIYYDTADFRLIRTSLAKPLYKEKLRLRTYGKTNGDTNAFIEIKKKYDGVVYKRRIAGAYKDAYNYLDRGEGTFDDSQIAKEIEAMCQTYGRLIPAMRINYDRVAYVGVEDKDLRITFDTNLTWSTDRMDLRKDMVGNPLLSADEFMMEIKVANAMPMELVRTLSELSIFPASFSKYGKGYLEMASRQEAKTAARIRAVRKFGKGVVAYA